MALPEGLTYGQVRWRAVTPLADGADVDGFPDAQPVSGTVTFTPSPSELMVSSVGEDPVTVISASLVFQLDEDGVLRDSEGRDGLYLMATDNPDVSPVNWTWRADYRLFNGASRGSFAFALPGGTTVDLTTVAPVATSNGTQIIQGPKGDPGPQGDPGPAGAGVPSGGTSGQLIGHNGVTTLWESPVGTGAAGALPNTLVRRNATGGADFGSLWIAEQDTGPDAVTRKDYVDAGDQAALDVANGLDNRVLWAPDPYTIPERGADGNAAFTAVILSNAPSSADQATRKDYVDRGDRLRGASFQTGTAYTFVLDDATRQVDFSNAASIIATIPTNASVAYPVGTVLHFTQFGAGYVNVVGAGGVTVNAPNGYQPWSGGPSSTMYAIKRDTDHWFLTGDLSLTTPTQTNHPTRKDYVDTKVAGTSGEVMAIRRMTQAAYNALGTKDATTLYVIQG